MSLKDPAKFFSAFRTTLGRGWLNQGQVAGTSTILNAWDARVPGSDVRFVAYSLATSWHETAFKMLPIREEGSPVYFRRMYDPMSGDESRARLAVSMGALPGDGAIFYGRGYVQTTWRRNYERFSPLIGVDLVANPDVMLRPDVASKVMIIGMLDGLFTGRRLANYFNEKTDFINARRVINGIDCAMQIAVYGEHFWAALKDGGWS
jgi:putative chitinase